MKVYKKYGWGRVFVTKKPTPFDWEEWVFDNGAFAHWKKGEDFDEDIYRRRLDEARKVKPPYFAVAPDLIGKGKESLAFSLEWMKRLPEDWPWYLAVQDGMTIPMVEPHLDRFDGIFLGGTDDFKASAFYWLQLARAHNKKLHYGRASTKAKIFQAKRLGVDSMDSTQLLWSKEKLKKGIEWLYAVDEQTRLFSEEEVAVKPSNIFAKA